jgi:hypothetical protein
MPAVSGEFTKWWHNFLKWTFFPPILAFFMYLAIRSQEGLNDLIGGAVGTGTGGTFINEFSKIASNMLLVVALLVGGLMMAQSLGMTGASAMLGLAKGAGNGVKKGLTKYAGNKAQQVATAPLRTSWGKAATEGMQRIPGLRTIGFGLAKARMAQEKKVADAAKKLPKDLKEQALMSRAASTTAPERVAIAANVSKERNARKKKENAAKKDGDKAKESLSSIQANENDELDKAGNDVGKRNEVKTKYSAAKKAAEDAVKAAEARVKDAADSMKEIDDVIALLPKNIQKDFAKSQARPENEGQIKMEDTRLGQRYGRRPGAVMPTEGKTEKVEAAIKAISEEEEGGKGEGKGREKKEEEKKEEEKKEDKKSA